MDKRGILLYPSPWLRQMGVAPPLLCYANHCFTDMINYKQIELVLREWSDETERYLKLLAEYNSTPKIVRWFKNIVEPCRPMFHSRTLIMNYDDIFIVELRYWAGDVSLAVRLGNVGYKIDVETCRKSGLLGGRFGEIDSFHSMMVMEIRDNLYDIIHNVDQSKKEPEWC